MRAPPEIASRLTWIGAPAVGVVVLLVGWLLYPEPDDRTQSDEFFRRLVVAPEPGDRFRYALALIAPLLLLGVVVLAYRSGAIRRTASGTGGLIAAVAAQVIAVGCSIWFLLEQEVSYFETVDVVIALVLTGAAIAWWWRRPTWRLPGERAVQATAAYVVSALVALSYLLTTVVTDRGIGRSLRVVYDHVPFTMGEFTSFANGRTPLVDFVPQYTTVLPWIVGPWLGLTDGRITAFSLAMVGLTALGLLAVLVVFRSVTTSAPAAAALFLPFVALTFLRSDRDGAEFANIGTYYAVLPMRYVGPWLAVAACLPYLRRPSRRWLALAAGVAGLVAVNNVDWGIPTLGAVGLCLFCGAAVGPDRRWRHAIEIGVALVLGFAAAVALITALTLVRAGALPDFDLALEFPRLFAEHGFFLIAAPAVAPFLVLYLTFVAALALAVGRTLTVASRSLRDRVADGALAFGGVFGLATGTYYMGRSHPLTLYALFSAWAFVIVLLAHEAFRAGRRRVPATWAVPMVAVVFLFGLAAATLREVPAPWRQIDRITTPGAGTYNVEPLVPFIQANTTDGEEVAIISIQSHRIAMAAGVHDVSPFNNSNSIVSFDQLDLLIERINDEDVETVIVGRVYFTEITDALAADGWDIVEVDPATHWTIWRR